MYNQGDVWLQKKLREYMGKKKIKRKNNKNEKMKDKI